MKPTGFFFNDSESFVPRCDVCENRYTPERIQINLFPGGWEVCPSCLLKGLKAVADVLRKKKSNRDFLRLLDTVGDFREIPGGIMAVRIAEAHREIKATNRKKKAA